MSHWENFAQVPAAWQRLRGVLLTLEQARQIYLEKAHALAKDTGRGPSPNYSAAREAFLAVHEIQGRRWVLKEGSRWP